MELRILNIVALLKKKTSLKDDMGLILTYIGILPFFAAAILKTFQNGRWDPKYRLLTS